MKKSKLKSKLESLSQKLDHMVPDPDLTKIENEKASAELAAISSKLYTLLPDPSLSPMERIERLRRIVDNVEPDMEQLQTAVNKVNLLNSRLNEFVSDENMTALQKIDSLVEKIDNCIDDNSCSFGHKVEKLGDPRAGIEPITNN